jgi:protein-L-isoaspartate(D-aspartate) O-methyltransferase
MVVEQLRARGLRHERVLAAMGRVPRERFVPEADRGVAYDDRPLPIGLGQTISQPYMVAVMTVALDPQPGDRVLEVGTGSGYQAAVLAGLCREVVSVERHERLAAAAREALAGAGVTNVIVHVGDGSLGYPEGRPYDGIVVTAAAPAVPEALRAQLADGGRLVIPIGGAGYQELVVERRSGSRLSRVTGEGCVFVPLVGQQGFSE